MFLHIIMEDTDDIYASLELTNSHIVNVINNKRIISVKKTDSYNDFECIIQNPDGSETKQILFFKFAPIIDYVKFLTGETSNISIHEAINQSIDNSAYIDGLFSFLASELSFKCNNFFGAVEWFSTVIGFKRNFIANIIDDYEYIHKHPFLLKNNGILFELEHPFINVNKKIELCNKVEDIELGDEEFDDINIPKKETKDSICLSQSQSSYSSYSSHSTNSSYSSCTSNTNSSFNSDDDCYSSVDSEESSSDEEYDDDELNIKIFDFPVNAIAMEKCEGGTLDKLIHSNKLTEDEWRSILFQIVIVLLKYNRVFKFTHNDSHTRNWMIVHTNISHLHINVNNQNYKVPTFGRIIKLIDFGRVIFEYNGIRYCSSCFGPDGDAYGQYNTEPFFNPLKKRVDPNPSFDLTRLACSIFDYIYEEDNPEVFNIINEWCMDDKGRNVLYKRNGDERYPDFKLYKMIPRTCHNNSPELQINNKFFDTLKTDESHKDTLIV
jgi:hypothetical protein